MQILAKKIKFAQNVGQEIKGNLNYLFDHLPSSFCGYPPLSTLLGLIQEE